MRHKFFGALIVLCISASATLAQTTAFTYQGKLADTGNLANGTYDFQFKLFDVVSGGNQQGAILTLNGVAVSNGIFTVTLDFGACASCFPGADRFLEIGVKASGGGPFTTLTPRQQMTATTYAIRSLTATAADGLSVACVNCVTSSQIQSVNGSVVTGTIPVASVPAGSANYIQNAINQQASSNFYISGNGTAAGTLTGNSVNAITQYNIGGQRVLSAAGTKNLFAGINAGTNITTGGTNAFFGNESGSSNTIGDNNSFFGFNAGLSNDIGLNNSFFGKASGSANTSGNANSFFGVAAGNLNTTGFQNSFFGVTAGEFNTTGSDNTFLGVNAGLRNTTGFSNTFIGVNADFNASNPTGHNNTLLGTVANVDSAVNNATAIGFRASVTQSNALVLGSINGINGANADTFVGIGTTAPQQTLHVNGFEILATGLNGGFKFRDRGSSSGTDDWVWYSNGNVARFFRAGVGDLLTIQTNGIVALNALGPAGATQLCRNASNQISTCSSSLRYKKNLQAFTRGLAIINRLKPLAFRWKGDNLADLGFGAEDVAAVEPLLVTHNERGEIEGVKYDRLAAVFVNAFKEQQAQIKEQQVQLLAQERELENLKQWICLKHPKSVICKSTRPVEKRIE